MRVIPTVLLLSACAWLASCSTQEVYTGESFAADSPFKMRVEGDVAPACESARRSLLGQGYLIESASEEGIKARKATRGGETQNTFIEMNVVCLPEARGSVLFATGVLTTYALKKSSSSASVGLAAVGSISLPIGQSADSLVKISEQTIDDKDFYGRFFMAVSNTLDEMNAGKAPPEVTAEPAVPETAPVQPAAIAPPVQIVQPDTATPGVTPQGAAGASAQSLPATAPTTAPPVIATTPAPPAGPAPTAITPEYPALPEAPAPTPEPALTEQAPTYTLQPDPAPPATASPVVPPADPDPLAAEQAPAAEPAPATGKAEQDAQPVTSTVAPAPEPAPQPAPDPSNKTEPEPAGDNTLLFL